MAALVVFGTGCRAPAARAHVIAIRAFQYLPESLTVATGDTVIWNNTDIVPHTATAAKQTFDTGSIDAKASARFVAADTGTHPYVCAFHPTMRGTLVVR